MIYEKEWISIDITLLHSIYPPPPPIPGIPVLYKRKYYLLVDTNKYDCDVSPAVIFIINTVVPIIKILIIIIVIKSNIKCIEQ